MLDLHPSYNLAGKQQHDHTIFYDLHRILRCLHSFEVWEFMLRLLLYHQGYIRMFICKIGLHFERFELSFSIRNHY